MNLNDSTVCISSLFQILKKIQNIKGFYKINLLIQNFGVFSVKQVIK